MPKMSDEEYAKAKQEFENAENASFESMHSIAYSQANAEMLADKLMSEYGLVRDRKGISGGSLRYHSQKQNGAVSVTLAAGKYFGCYNDYRTDGIGSGSVFTRYFERLGIREDEKLEKTLSLVPVEKAKAHYEKFVAPMAFDKWLYEEKGFVTNKLYQLNQGNAPVVQLSDYQQRWQNALHVTAEEIAERNAMYAKAQDFRTIVREEKIPFSMDRVIPDNQVETFAYLTQIRGLDKEMIQNLMDSGKIMTYFYQGSNPNGSTYLGEKKFGFPMQNCNGEIVGMDARPLYHETDKKSSIEKGSPSGSSFVEFQCGRCNENATVVFFEAAIDALSYMEMYGKDRLQNVRLISTQGANNTAKCAEMIIEAYQTKPEHIFIATDNDGAGNEVFTELRKKYPIPEENRLTPPEGKKDWNSYLCHIKGIDEGLKKTSDSYLAEVYSKWFSNQGQNLFPEQPKYQFQKPVRGLNNEPEPEVKAETEDKEEQAFPEYKVSSRTRVNMPNNPNIQIPVNQMRPAAAAISELMIENYLETYNNFNGEVKATFPNIYCQEFNRSGISLTDNGIKLQLGMPQQAIREGTVEFSGFSTYCFATKGRNEITENQQVLLTAMANKGLLNENQVKHFLEHAVIIPSIDKHGNEKPVRKLSGRSELPDVTPENIQEVLDKAAETRIFYEKAMTSIKQQTAVLEQMKSDPDYRAEVGYLYQDLQNLHDSGEQVTFTEHQRFEMQAYLFLTEKCDGSIDAAIQKMNERARNGEMKVNELNQQCRELQAELGRTQVHQINQQEYRNAS